MNDEDYNQFISQLKNELNASTALANKYGIILASNLEEFKAGKVISQNLLEFILDREQIENEIKNESINSFILESLNFNYIFIIEDFFILICKLELNTNLANFSKKANLLLKLINDKEREMEVNTFSIYDFSKEISKIEVTLNETKSNAKKYDIIKDLIKYISK